MWDVFRQNPWSRSAEVSYGHPGMDFGQKSALYKKLSKKSAG